MDVIKFLKMFKSDTTVEQLIKLIEEKDIEVSEMMESIKS
jgi:hypothetical protein